MIWTYVFRRRKRSTTIMTKLAKDFKSSNNGTFIIKQEGSRKNITKINFEFRMQFEREREGDRGRRGERGWKRKIKNI